jgi:hypothetical protein
MTRSIIHLFLSPSGPPDSNQPADLPVKEEQVDIVVLVIYRYPFLPGDERESGPAPRPGALDPTRSSGPCGTKVGPLY